MSRITNVVIVSIIALGLTACETSPSKPNMPEASAYDARCKFRESEKLAPEWVCKDVYPGLPVVGRGSYQKSKMGEQFMRDQAALKAREALVAAEKAYIESAVKSFMAGTGVGDADSADVAASTVSKQLAYGDVTGSRVVDSVWGPDGTLYVLVGLDAERAASIAKKAIKSSMNNDKALWQQFLAGKEQDKMAADIANLKKEAQ